MLGCIGAKGRMEYQFSVFGRLSVVYMDVELHSEVGASRDEYLNAVVQLIAKADGMYLH